MFLRIFYHVNLISELRDEWTYIWWLHSYVVYHEPWDGIVLFWFLTGILEKVASFNSEILMIVHSFISLNNFRYSVHLPVRLWCQLYPRNGSSLEICFPNNLLFSVFYAHHSPFFFPWLPSVGYLLQFSSLNFYIRCAKLLLKLETGFNFQLCKDICQVFTGHYCLSHECLHYFTQNDIWLCGNIFMFRKYGTWVARNPTLILGLSLAIVLLLCLGLIRFKVETRPEKVIFDTK